MIIDERRPEARRIARPRGSSATPVMVAAVAARWVTVGAGHVAHHPDDVHGPERRLLVSEAKYAVFARIASSWTTSGDGADISPPGRPGNRR